LQNVLSSNFFLIESAEFFKQLIGKRSDYGPTSTKHSFSRFVQDTLKQQHVALLSLIQLLKVEMGLPDKLKLERWLEVLYKARSIARLEKERGTANSSTIHFYVQRELVIGCQAFYAAQVFRKLMAMKPRSIILTSGTLTPFSEIESELNLHFPVKLVNDHVIDRKNALIASLKGGESGQYLNLSHLNLAKNGLTVSEDVGRAVASIVRECKEGGVLVFF